MPGHVGFGPTQVPDQRLIAAVLALHLERLPVWRLIARRRAARSLRQLAGAR